MMNSAFPSATLLNGLILGWPVAWPPRLVNAKMIRRDCRRHPAAVDVGPLGESDSVPAPEIPLGARRLSGRWRVAEYTEIPSDSRRN